MDALGLRNKVLQHIIKADNRLLVMINALAESYHSQEEISNDLTDGQKKELDKRLTSIEKGEVQYYSWEEAKDKLSIK